MTREELEAWEAKCEIEDAIEKRQRRLFCNQKSGARERGIPFEMTFREWKGWWIENLGPCWMEKRGAGRGKYVMARYGDKGPYRLGNVKCITSSENTREGQRGRAKLTEAQVIAILNSVGTQRQIGVSFGVCQTVVGQIKAGVLWSHVTKLPRKFRN